MQLQLKQPLRLTILSHFVLLFRAAFPNEQFYGLQIARLPPLPRLAPQPCNRVKDATDRNSFYGLPSVDLKGVNPPRCGPPPPPPGRPALPPEPKDENVECKYGPYGDAQVTFKGTWSGAKYKFMSEFFLNIC